LIVDEDDRTVKEPPAMIPLSRRDFLAAGCALTSTVATASAAPKLDDPRPVDVHRQLLELAAQQEERRRARFAAVTSKAGLEALQASLRETVLRLLDGFPEKPGIPPARVTGTIVADDYVIEKLTYESFPGYFVTALLYRPKQVTKPLPGVLSPCGHSTNGKAAGAYQILHINLAKRGFVVLTYDPVGQGERSQFWDARKHRSRFDLSCGEHAVLGNPLYLLGSSLARYRIWDGMRGLDYLASRPEVDASQLGCVGNSGGGTLTAYIAALDPRVEVAAICCYITTLPRRMANRIQQDPSADPEQDIFGFVSEGIDHAGLLALRAPRPTLIGSAVKDFFPIEGARESFAEAKRLYEAAGAGHRIAMAEAPGGHGLSGPLRRAVYHWFDSYFAAKGEDQGPEFAVKPRPDAELQVCADGQVNLAMRSRPLLPMAWEEFERKPNRARVPLHELLRLDPARLAPRNSRNAAASKTDRTAIVCVNGNESGDWREDVAFLRAVERLGHEVLVIDPCGVGPSRPSIFAGAPHYADPLSGVEENIAYNAFLVGKSLLGMRVADVLAAIERSREKVEPRRIIVCGRRDAALVACLAAAVSPAIDGVACQDMLHSFRTLFSAEGHAINAASILPDLLEQFGDISDIIARIAPRKVLVASGIGEFSKPAPHVRIMPGRFSAEPQRLIEWLGD
jgi:dienelactone hydrolase/pimeloyl-ACP methyl ester carboxylesterase